MINPIITINELREYLKDEIEEIKDEIAVEKGYEKPKIKKLTKMRFPIDIIETGREGRVCHQCSSCHNCR